MAELLVPKIIAQLRDALEQLGERVNLVMGVQEEDVGNLSSKLATIGKVMHDAERRRLKENDVGTWLEKLEDITYEMDDVLDEWNIKILQPKKDRDRRAQFKSRTMPTLLEKVRSFIPSLCSCLKQVPVRSDIASKIKEINDKLELNLKEANQFNFVTSAPRRQYDFSQFKHPMTTSILDESKVYGRDSEKESVLEHLLSESSGSSRKDGEKNGIKVVSIVGVGGSGKTTLAQTLYNDDRVKQNFELRKWVCVSDPFDEKRIANALLESPEKSSYSGISELESLFQLLKVSFSRKKFLIVLDDVWTEDSLKWEPFKDSLKDGAPGSIILVTTRSEKVATAIGTNHKLNLNLLSQSYCWFIIKRIALSGRSELCEKVEKIGWKIAEKCKGLPLAAKTLGGLLQFKDSVQEWQEVLDSEIWQMEEVAVDIFPYFYLSYNELSPQLKRCFSYCATFPKDSRISVRDLILLWMAQGYLGSPSQRGDERLENKGYEYFVNLAMRSFFQELEENTIDENKIVSCKMHDIVHDFAQFLRKSECHSFDEVNCNRLDSDGGYSSKERARHVSLLGKTESISSIALNIGKLRTFSILEGEVPRDLFSCLKSVRSLTLSHSELRELPPEIGSLIHLRYMNLSQNPLEKLPEATCNLYFLETLNLTWCYGLHHLPQRFGELVHLRHLLNEMKDLEQMPRGFEKLTSLRTLKKFIAGGEQSNGIEMLKHLNQLEELNIFIHGNVDLQKAVLGGKRSLQKLGLYFEGKSYDIENPSWMEVMELPPNLRILVFWKYPHSQLPNRIVSDSLINNLVSLRIHDSWNLSSLPALWKLSSLEFLWLNRIPNLQLGGEFFGHFKFVAFCSLKKLWIEDLKSWVTWEDISEEDDEKINAVSVLPCLQELLITGCQKLRALPHRILKRTSSLKKLEVWDCRKLAKHYSDKTGDNWKKISHIPQVSIREL